MANEKTLDLSTLQAGLKRYDDSLADVAKSGDYDDLQNKPTIPEIIVIDGSKECARYNDASGEYSFALEIPDDLNPYDYAVISIMQQMGGWVNANRDGWTDEQREGDAGDSTPNISWMYDETEDKWTISLTIYNNTSSAVTLKYRVVFMKVS